MLRSKASRAFVLVPKAWSLHPRSFLGNLHLSHEEHMLEQTTRSQSTAEHPPQSRGTQTSTDACRLTTSAPAASCHTTTTSLRSATCNLRPSAPTFALSKALRAQRALGLAEALRRYPPAGPPSPFWSSRPCLRCEGHLWRDAKQNGFLDFSMNGGLQYVVLR